MTISTISDTINIDNAYTNYLSGMVFCFCCFYLFYFVLLWWGGGGGGGEGGGGGVDRSLNLTVSWRGHKQSFISHYLDSTPPVWLRGVLN